MTDNENEIYESLRISTVFSGHSFVTTGVRNTMNWNDTKDDAFFKAHPRRRFLLWIANSGEFDTPVAQAQNATIPVHRILPAPSAALQAVYAQIPPMWALVSRILPAIHVVTAVYRGTAFFGTVEDSGRTLAAGDDDRVGALMSVFAMKQGIDGHEWIAFERKYKATVVAINGAKSDKVN